jgi:hypothetical protein
MGKAAAHGTQRADARPHPQPAKFLDERRAKEQDDIRAILGELEKGIRDELNTGEPEQLALWSDAERDQLHRNRDALRLRLEALPGELEPELAAIEKKI